MSARSLSRLLTGLGIGAMLSTINPMAAEYANARRRDLSVTLLNVGYPLGGMIGGITAAQILPVLGWRAIFITAAGLAVVVGVIVATALPEPIPGILARPDSTSLARLNRYLAHCAQPPLTALPEMSTGNRRSFALLLGRGEWAKHAAHHGGRFPLCAGGLLHPDLAALDGGATGLFPLQRGAGVDHHEPQRHSGRPGAEPDFAAHRAEGDGDCRHVPDSNGNNANFTDNIGSLKIYGVEVETQALVTKTTLLSADIQYLHAQNTSFIDTTGASAPPVTGCPSALTGAVYTINCSGFAANNAPRWTMNVSAQQTIPLGAYKSRRYINFAYVSDGGGDVDHSWQTNAQISFGPRTAAGPSPPSSATSRTAACPPSSRPRPSST